MTQDHPLPDGRKYPRRLWIAIGITTFICVFLIWLDTHKLNHYTDGLFLLTPFFSGFCTVLLYGEKNITRGRAFGISLLTLALIFAGLLLLQIDGLICLVMAAPLVIPVNFVGAIIGRSIVNRRKSAKIAVIVLFIAGIPSLGFLEESSPPTVHSVVTSIEIAAPPEAVWRHVVTFPKLDEPEELIFKTGIAYPVDATIDGEGLGAVRHCNFTTGSFVEPITVWDEPRLLKFSVEEQPAPLKELSYTDIDAPHLHDFFVSQEGQFRLQALPNGHTLLEGTTWYYHRIRPAAYWRLWSDHIIHEIHGRVLRHIKKNAEQEIKPIVQHHEAVKSVQMQIQQGFHSIYPSSTCVHNLHYVK
ncbi:SRPBCC family protein [Chitinophaga sp. GCM10012297]|uniref:SRPBCC family protein n=1 Tax=Chitinophaga chungangae TaxID=2821488 RepID=A0ABS3YI27_9BACT|nr:SRPBCC family protein [Chitinophaga chungangae]MBO9154349.1 SRPBCC family protein [Chitinophaga chungangae]